MLMGPPAPMATQLVLDEHDTFVSRTTFPPTGLGLGTSDQLVPSNCSTNVALNVPVNAFPTAKQLVTVGHDTRERKLPVAPGAFGLAMIDHACPSQRSTSVALNTASSECEPTAKHVVVEGHETPVIENDAPGGIANDSADHTTPFQCSRYGYSSRVADSPTPTAKQLVADAHETEVRRLPVTPGGSGTLTIVHRAPSQRCSNGLGAS